MLAIAYLFEKREPYDSHGSFQDFFKMKDKLNAVQANKKLTVQKDERADPVPSNHPVKLKNVKPIKAKITVRMGVIDQEN